MNRLFDGSSPIAILQHLTSKVYKVAFLNYGFHIDAWQNFMSVWPLEIWVLIILVLIYSIKGMKSELHLAFLVLLIWPLLIY
ncbi:MAG: hypothetical protein VX619_00820, partial [bacterium]|nr:hypothetical protein [bacterium]